MSLNPFIEKKEKNAIKITPVLQKNFKQWLSAQTKTRQAWIETTQFKAIPATHCVLPNAQGKPQEILLGVKDENDFWSFGALPALLPIGNYWIDAKYTATQFENIALAWGLGSYQFLRYKKQSKIYSAKLVLSASIDKKSLKEMISVFYFIRDSINTPTEDFGPAEL